MPSSNIELTISQGEYFEYSFLYEVGAAGADLAGWGGILTFADVNGIVVQLTEVDDPFGQIELSDGSVTPQPDHNVKLRLETAATSLMGSSGEYELILFPNPADPTVQPQHWIRGQYKVQTLVGG